MSDLYNLSAPIEDQHDLKPQGKVKKSTINFPPVKEKLKEYQKKFGKKLLISLGISVSVVALIIALLHISQPTTVQAPDEHEIIEQTNENGSQTLPDGVKFTRFDGNQYFFYFPENYSYLNRSLNSELNEVAFSNRENSDAFLLKEHEYFSPSEDKLAEIYTQLWPGLGESNPREEIIIGQNTFTKSTHTICNPNISESLASGCAPKFISIYSTVINGLLVTFVNPDLEQTEFEQTILNTFTANMVDSNNLAESYVLSNLPRISKRLDAQLLLGMPKNVSPETPCIDCETTLTYQLKDSMEVILEFDPNNNLSFIYGRYAKFKFDLSATLRNSTVPVNPQKVHDVIANNPNIQKSFLDPNPNAIIYLEEDPSEPEYWLVTILSEDSPDALKLTEYRISKNTGQFKTEE